MVRGTAVAADLARQSPATVPVTHYEDMDKVCRDCGRRFIFFAEEQKHWYEYLGFPLEADAVRCPPCRKRLQHIAGRRRCYEEAFHLPRRTVEGTLAMAECCLVLIEEAIFHSQQTERVRMLLKRIPQEKRSEQQFLDLSAQVRAAETKESDPSRAGWPACAAQSRPLGSAGP